MANNAINQFDLLFSDYLSQNPTYELQLRNFRDFLTLNKLEDKVFNLYSNHLDLFFSQALNKNIGSQSQVTLHITALKSFFGYLINKQYKFSELNGYISTVEFKKNIMKGVDKTKNKIIMTPELLLKLLTSLDAYIKNYENIFRKIEVREQIYFEMLIVRLFIKLSLVLPLRTSQMLEVTLSNIQNDATRCLTYNEINIKIPNNLRKEILDTLDYSLSRYNGPLVKTNFSKIIVNNCNGCFR